MECGYVRTEAKTQVSERDDGVDSGEGAAAPSRMQVRGIIAPDNSQVHCIVGFNIIVHFGDDLPNRSPDWYC